MGFLKIENILAEDNERDFLRKLGKLGRSNPPGGICSPVSHDDSSAIDSKEDARLMYHQLWLFINIRVSMTVEIKCNKSCDTEHGDSEKVNIGQLRELLAAWRQCRRLADIDKCSTSREDLER